MADVTLTLKANNSDYVKKMKEAQDASQKVYDTVDKGTKQEKGRIEELRDTIEKLRVSRDKAYSLDKIEAYNKRIKEETEDLKELEQAGLKVEKQTETLTQSIGKWVVGLGIATTVMNALKKAFLETTAGMNLFNIAGAAVNNMLYNIVSGTGQWNKGLAETIALQKELNEIRRQNYADDLRASVLMREYNKLYTEGIDHTISSEEKVRKLTEAKKKYVEAVKVEIASTQQLLLNAKKWALLQPGNEKWTALVFQYGIRINELLGQAESGTRRLNASISLEIQNQLEELEKWRKELKSVSDGLDELVENYLKEQNLIATKNKNKPGSAGSLLGMTLFGEDDVAIIKKVKDFRAKTEVELSKLAKSSETWAENQREILQQVKDAEDEIAQTRKDNFEQAGNAVLSYINLIDELALREVDKAQRDRELLDTKVSEAQSALQTEIELKKQGYASDVVLKQKQLDTLKVQREKALKEEEESRKKEHALKIAAVLAESAVAVAKVIMNAEIAKTEARVMMASMIIPLQALGAVRLAQTRVAEALSIAAIMASAVAASVSKYAKGGWTGKGSIRDETGEKIAGITHEEEFVVRKGPAKRFREVLEAINKEDRGLIVNRFNKVMPEFAPVNNIRVDNNGPNNRLDRVNNKLSQISKQLEPKKQSKEEVIITGKGTVYRKGNTTRIVR